jgi:hypothetical protein
MAIRQRWRPADNQEMIALIRNAVAGAVTFFDTAEADDVCGANLSLSARSPSLPF